MSELHYNDCGHACCLRVENLSVKIGNDRILSDVNLHVHCGELVALIGPICGTMARKPRSRMFSLYAFFIPKNPAHPALNSLSIYI